MCVPKRMGGGWTVNFGNPLGVGLFIALVIFPFVLVGLIILFQYPCLFQHTVHITSFAPGNLRYE